jgi:dTDP-4-dehydrorhamnose reductase
MLLIVGASGFLGGNVLYEAHDSNREAVGVYHETPLRSPRVRSVEADLALPGAADEILESLKPDWVLNCAALANVDACEKDEDLARQMNVDLPRYLAKSCQDAKVKFLHVSTDSVFDGEKGDYNEEDLVAPVNVYAQTKVEGERAVFNEMIDALVVRTNFVGFSSDKSTGLAHWIIRELSAGKRISGFSDVVFSPLAANDLAQILFAMMDKELNGLYHVAASDSLTKLDFARQLARELELDESLIDEAHLSEANLTARRPLNTSLSSSRAEADLGRKMPSSRDTIAKLGKLFRDNYPQKLHELTGT